MEIIFAILAIILLTLIFFSMLKKEKVEPSTPKKELYPDRTPELILFLENNKEKITSKEQLRDIILSYEFNYINTGDPKLTDILNEINHKINQMG